MASRSSVRIYEGDIAKRASKNDVPWTLEAWLIELARVKASNMMVEEIRSAYDGRDEPAGTARECLDETTLAMVMDR